jgi:hypothetical protein
VEYYDVYRNGTPYIRYVTNKPEAGIPEGTYTYYVKAYDNAGNESGSSGTSDPIVVDKTDPNPGSLSYGTITTSSIAVTVSGASDALSDLPANYCYIEYDEDATTFSSADANSGWCDGSWTPSGLSVNTAYAFRWKVKDNAGNETEWQTPTPAYRRTKPAPADAICNKTTSTWYQGSSDEKFDFTSSNLDSADIYYYRYKWDRSPSTAVTVGDSQWSSSALPLTPYTSKANYLHVLPYNTDDEAGDQANYGPYYFMDTSRRLKHGRFFDDDGQLQRYGQ